MKLAIKTWEETLKVLRQNPIILLPFFIVGLFDVLLLILIYLAPRPPLSALLAPPIRAFWGERFLHYPLNLLLIPRLFNYGHIISTAFIGVLMTGAAIGMLKQAKEGCKPNILFNLIKSLRMYLGLLVIWLVMFGLVSAAFKGLPAIFHFKQGAASQIVFYAAFFISILIEAIFLYAIPAVIIEEKKAGAAIRRSISFSKSAFLLTLILVALPTFIYIPMIILGGKLPVLINRVFPEVVLIFLAVRIVISVVIDCLITCSTAVLFLNKREEK